jgi:hypothetical protein
MVKYVKTKKRSLEMKKEKERCLICGRKAEYVLESGFYLCGNHSNLKKSVFESEEDFLNRIKQEILKN